MSDIRDGVTYYWFIRKPTNDESYKLMLILGTNKGAGITYGNNDGPAEGMWFDGEHQSKQHEDDCIKWCEEKGLLMKLP